MINFKKISKFMRICGSSFFLVVAVGTSHAEDIELYAAIFAAQENLGDASSDPNVLFILDNSGSMGAFRLIQETAGDITQLGSYDPTLIYPTSNSTATRDTNVYVYSTDDIYQSAYFTEEQNQCAASKDTFLNNPSLPIHQDVFIKWDRSGNNNNNVRYIWKPANTFISSTDSSRILECEDDNGVDGNNGNTSQTYPALCWRYNGNNSNRCTSGSGDALYATSQQTLTFNGTTYDFPYEMYITGGSGNSGLTYNQDRKLVDGNYHQYLVQSNSTNTDEPSASDCNNDDDILINASTGAEYRCLTRLEIMKRALTLAVDGDPNDTDDNGVGSVNLGLMRFNRNNDDLSNTSHGGTLIDKIEAANGLDDPDDTSSTRTNKDDFVDKVEDIAFEVYTPLSESMYEAYRYFNGDSPLTSETSSNTTNQPVLDSKAVDGDDNFISPIGTNQCQENYVVMLSDGSPTNDGSLDNTSPSYIQGITGIEDCGGGDNCLDEIAGALKENLGVYTYTIGFNADIDLLKDAALEGSPNDNAVLGDGYYLADDLQSLTTTFQAILGEIQIIDNDNFNAPAITVNAFNRLQNRTDIYYSLFEPEVLPRWNGNIKKYKIRGDATIVDANGNDAIDDGEDGTGFFTSDSQSYWSTSVDGPNVTLGGFASKLTEERNFYANLDSSNTVSLLAEVGVNSSVSNMVDALTTAALANGDSTGTTLGLSDSSTGVLDPLDNTLSDVELNLDSVVRWTLGQDVEGRYGNDNTFDDANFFASESIHSTPFVLSYGGDDDFPKDIVFVASNQGILHAINGQDQSQADGDNNTGGGDELWVYLPDYDLAKNLGGYFNNALPNNTNDDGDQQHIYGLDGEIAFDVERDANSDITKAHLFMGQRRGGNKIFAIDVTDADSSTAPVKKLWTAEGGSGDLARLGQTWAKPIVTQMRHCENSSCSIKDVLVVGGGYDTDYDDRNRSISELADGSSIAGGGSQDTLGNAIYILDASNGSVLWSVSNTAANAGTGGLVIAEMDHSIPSSPTVLDVNKDGAIDIIFAVDLAGQIFRFDFRQDTSGSAEVRTGGMIADLKETSGGNSVDRRFYNPVDVALLPATDDGAEARFALVTGSGYRSHPLTSENVPNRLYVIYDNNITGPLLNGTTPEYKYVLPSSGTRNTIDVEGGDLTLVDGELTAGTAEILPGSTHKYGYFVNLVNTTSEKIINPTLISDFQVIAVSYMPSDGSSNICSSQAGSSRAYNLDLLTGEVKSQLLLKPGISAAPVIVYVLETDSTSGEESLEPVVIIGTEPFQGADFDIESIDLGKADKKAWWEKGRAN